MDKKRNRGVMLFISVLFHSLLALLPWQEKSRSLTVSSNPTSPIPIVDASQLPTLPALESQPLPAVPPSPPVPEAPIPETSDIASDDPVLEVALPLEASIPETSDIASDDPAPQPTPEADPFPVTPIDEVKITTDWEYLVGHLQDQDEGFGFTLFEIFDLFGEPGQVNQFFDENNQPKFDDSSFSHFPTQTPEQVWQTVVMPELTSKTGFELQPQENFSAGLAYQLLQGEMLRYVIIVRLNEDSGSVLMLSESLMGLEP